MNDTLGMGTMTQAGDETVRQQEAYDARFRDAARLIADGQLTTGMLVSRETSDRRYRGVQLVIGVFEVDDPNLPAGSEPRTVVYEHIFGPASARKWRPGRQVDVWIDPDDPENIYVGR